MFCISLKQVFMFPKKIKYFALSLLLSSCLLHGENVESERKNSSPTILKDNQSLQSTTTTMDVAPAVQSAKSNKKIYALPTYLEKPVKIGVTFVLNEIGKVNEAAGTFEANVDIQLEWHDPSLVFDPKEEGTFRQELCFEQASEELAKIWNPDIVIANMNEKPIKLKQCLFLHADGTVIYLQRVKAVFETKFNLAAFPFDTQYLSVKLQSNRYNNTEILFMQNQEQINQSGVREGTTFSGWTISGIDYFYTTLRALNGTFSPIFEAKIVISRTPWNYLISFAPLLLIIMVPTIITLYAVTEMGTRLSNWSGAILALIALSFTLNLRYPALGPDSILAQLIAIVFCYEFLMICLSLTVLEDVKTKNKKNPYVMPEIVDFLRWGVPLGLIILIVARVLLTMLS